MENEEFVKRSDFDKVCEVAENLVIQGAEVERIHDKMHEEKVEVEARLNLANYWNDKFAKENETLRSQLKFLKGRIGIPEIEVKEIEQ